MNKLLDKIFFRYQNLNYVKLGFRDIKKKTEVAKIFDAINYFSTNSEIRYVGGCVRKIINKEKVDDIDLAVNLKPVDVCEALKNKKIKYYESGIEHGTITALINDFKSGARKNPAMLPYLKNLSQNDFKELAAYASKLKVK